MPRSAFSLVVKLTNAYPRPASLAKSMGRYTKSYMPSSPCSFRRATSSSRLRLFGQFRSITVVKSFVASFVSGLMKTPGGDMVHMPGGTAGWQDDDTAGACTPQTD